MTVLRPLPDGPEANLLRQWDCCYEPSSYGADLFERFYRQLLDDVYGGACGTEVIRYLQQETAIVAGFFGDLDRPLLDPESRWLPAGGRDAAFRRAAQHALAQPSRPWAERKFMFRHLMFGGRLPRFMGFDRGPSRCAAAAPRSTKGRSSAKPAVRQAWRPPTASPQTSRKTPPTPHSPAVHLTGASHAGTRARSKAGSQETLSGSRPTAIGDRSDKTDTVP